MKVIFPLLLLGLFARADAQGYREERDRMVESQIVARGVRHPATLAAMRKVERHLFVPASYRKYAYEDTALPIGYDQTISQPYIVALMTGLVRPEAGDRILEIGTGSGYQAAVLAEIADSVFTIEIVEELAGRTNALLKKLGYNNIHQVTGDGYGGLPEEAPFDAILVTAAAGSIPPALIAQLKEGGRMVIPLGSPGTVQELKLVEKRKGRVVTTSIAEVRFVPFTRQN